MIMPVLQKPRPSMSILVKNGCNNGGRGGKKYMFNLCMEIILGEALARVGESPG